jgi:hypothetical protein
VGGGGQEAVFTIRGLFLEYFGDIQRERERDRQGGDGNFPLLGEEFRISFFFELLGHWHVFLALSPSNLSNFPSGLPNWFEI